MILHSALNDVTLRQLIRNADIGIAGNRKLKIFGSMRCASGKRLKKENRVFFISQDEAIQAGFRPCGHCMRTAYREWKTANCVTNSK